MKAFNLKQIENFKDWPSIKVLWLCCLILSLHFFFIGILKNCLNWTEFRILFNLTTLKVTALYIMNLTIYML